MTSTRCCSPDVPTWSRSDGRTCMTRTGRCTPPPIRTTPDRAPTGPTSTRLAAGGLGVQVGWCQDGRLGAPVGDHADQAAGLAPPGQFDPRPLFVIHGQGGSVAYRVGN